jgi:hypothetical protein
LGLVIIIIHVDDCYTIGHKPAIKQVIQQLNQNGLKLKVSEDAEDYLEHQHSIGVNTNLELNPDQGPTVNNAQMCRAKRENTIAQHQLGNQLGKGTQVAYGDQLRSNHHNNRNMAQKPESGYAHN